MPARAAVLARLIDWAIPRDLLDHADLRLRARVLVGAASTLLLVGLVTSVLTIADGDPLASIGIVAAAICHLLAILFLRIRRSIDIGALLLSTGIILCSTFFAAHEGGLHVTTGAWLACVPLLTAFLCGGRMAMVAAAMVVLAMFGVWLVHANGLAFQLWHAHSLAHAPTWGASVSAYFVVALFAWRYSVERAATLEQLEDTVKGVEEHRNVLASVVERADATRRELVEISRVAGMADVATGVLHNVGNALNSAKTSGHVVQQRLDDLAKPRIDKLVALLPDDPHALAQFVLDDRRGEHLVPFLREVAAHWQRHTTEALAELERLQERLDHIHHIVSTQQAFARGRRGPIEACDPRDLVRVAVELVAGKGAGTVSIEDGGDLPPVVTDRHTVIQVLGNLLANAREAARDAGVSEPQVVIRTLRAAATIRIEVADNGVGMDPATLGRVFEHGFTTKSYGHGFGLHTAAIQIEELGGRITARSDGLGRGSTFLVELPLDPQRRAA